MADSRRDILVIGASAGGLEAVSSVLAQLPRGLGATVLVTVHVGRTASGEHVRLLGRGTPLPVRLARDGDTLYHGNVYVAPPDRHLLVAAGHMRVVRGPEENRSRPAIDPLFRSAAAVYRERVVGVLLTGFLDDGVAGLAAIQRAGGLTVVQDPSDAEVPDMPSAALARLEIDHVAPLHRMGTILTRELHMNTDDRTASPPESGDEALPPADGEPGVEDRVAAGEGVPLATQEDLGTLAGLGCPACGGPLLRVEDPDVRRYRCHIGHAYTTRALLADQSEQVERAVSAALRTLEERATLLDDMAREAGRGATGVDPEGLRTRAEEARRHAETLRRLLLAGVEDSAA